MGANLLFFVDSRWMCCTVINHVMTAPRVIPDPALSGLLAFSTDCLLLRLSFYQFANDQSSLGSLHFETCK